jgi:hypothetical protein
LWLIKVWFYASTFVVKIATFAKRQTVMPHPKKTTVLKLNGHTNEQSKPTLRQKQKSCTHRTKPTLCSTFAFAPTAPKYN